MIVRCAGTYSIFFSLERRLCRIDRMFPRAPLTDFSGTGPNGIIIVDLPSGKSWQPLHNHVSTRAELGFLPLDESRRLRETKPSGEVKPLSLGSDGIAIRHDRKQLFYCPLVSRRLLSVSVDAHIDSP
jgi:hypothetical protein